MISFAAKQLTDTIQVLVFHISDLDQDFALLLLDSDTSKEFAQKLRDLANTLDSLKEE